MELKHIVGYLPYGLKVLSKQTVFEMDTYSNMRGKDIEKRDIYSVMSNKMKPILRPLSDLTKEIEVNGEKFVPLLKIAKILGYDDLIKFDHEDGYEFIDYGYIERYEDDQQPLVFGYWKDGLFGFWYDDKDDNHPIWHFTSISAIELLYELHFDIHGIIEKGEAIDINTLK